METDRYSSFASYLNFISKTYDLQICIKDFVGFIPIDKDLDRALRPFLGHTNPYCMYIKSDINMYKKCQCMMKPMVAKCKKLNNIFYGVCHGGVGEYIVPIEIDGDLLGAISVGVFQADKNVVNYLIKRICVNSSKMQEKMALDLYYRFIIENHPDNRTIENILGIVAEYLANTYLNLKSTNMKLQLGKKRYNSSEDLVLAHAMEYIRQNFLQDISVPDIAMSCHCCESYINHLIKKRIGVNIKTYINKLRVEQAKFYLLNSNNSMADIAIKVGFSDPNYFSRIFTSLNSITPTEFRRRYS